MLRWIPLAGLLLAACEHSTPFPPVSYASDSSLMQGPLAQLTFNPARDLTPAWTPDASEIVYTAERLDRGDSDQCLAALPAPGGTILRYLCRTPVANDSVDVFQEVAVSADGRIAYDRLSSHRFPFKPLTPDVHALVLGSVDRPNDVRVLRSFPYTNADRVHSSLSHLGWLGPSRLVYLAEEVTYPRDCSSCAPDTVRTGVEIMTLDFSGAVPALATVPETSNPLSLAVGATGDTIYYTRNGDSRLYRYTFSSAKTDTLWDFAPHQLPRAIQVRGSRVYVVLDGRLDLGGDPHVIDLAAGTDVLIDYPAGFNRMLLHRRLSISPDGRRLALESLLAEVRVVGGVADTVPLGPTNIWRYDLP
jgi:hypothetical protein